MAYAGLRVCGSHWQGVREMKADVCLHRIGIVAQQRGAKRKASTRTASSSTYTNQNAVCNGAALMRLSDNKSVKMTVNWKGCKATLTEKLVIDIATRFLDS